MSNPPQSLHSLHLPWRPWRSAVVGWVVAAVALVIGVPLFVNMPPWCDVTLYAVAARNILYGGVHYRDVFDTNTPGYTLVLTGIYAVFGPNYPVIRVFDLLFLTASMRLLARMVRGAGGTPAAVAWMVAAVALFYPFVPEINHCQRDTWMMLPAVAATALRTRRVCRRAVGESGGMILPAVAEGCLWGVAVWIKPHVIVPAVAVWAAAALLAPWRWGLRELAGMLLGVTALGAAGVGWLVATGTWPYFLDIFLNWNPEYAGTAIEGTPDRILKTFGYFPPWSLAHILAIPLALASVVEAVVWASGRTMPAAGNLYTVAQTTQQRISRAVLGALYLGWLLQALVLQQPYDYIHVPETILAFAVIACQGWAVGLVMLGAALLSSVWILTYPESNSDMAQLREVTPALGVTRHPLTEQRVLSCWPRCWTEPGSLPLRDDLASLGRYAGGTRWEHLARVEAFLKTIDPPLRDHELTCWNDGTHTLYLSLGLEPSVRYMHFGTAFSFTAHVSEIRREVAASRQRYVVSDLVGIHVRTGDLMKSNDRYNVRKESPGAPGLDGRQDGLPFWFPRSQAAQFPWNQPVVFRSGRYLVHRVDGPVAPEQIVNLADLAEAGSGPGINSWAGEVPDDIPGPLPGGGGGSTTIILNEATFASAYNRLKFAPEQPRVDFTQFLVVIKLTRTQTSGLTAELDPDSGNLSVGLGWAVGAGEKLRYYVLAYPRAGVKSVAGFPISKP